MAGMIVRELASGVGRCEGPVIRTDGEIIVTSMTHGKLYTVENGKASVFSDVGRVPNGATEAADGTLYVTQSGGKHFGPNAGKGGIQAVARDGKWKWVTQDPVAPNDLCFGPDGWLYFTDPTRGRRDDGRIFRCDVATGEAQLLGTVPWYPNGIGIGLDDALYVAKSTPDEPGIVRFELANERLGKGEVVVKMKTGYRPDGFLFDVEGNIVIGANSDFDPPGEVQTFDKNGKAIDTLIPGDQKKYTNVALGADRLLVITDSDGERVLAVDNWPHAGLPLYPFRKKKA